MNILKQILLGLIIGLGLMLTVAPTEAAGTWWEASYWDNTEFEGDPVLVRREADLFYEWGRQSPAPGIVPADSFSVTWERTVDFNAGTYEFKVRADDMMRLYVDDQLIIDLWYPDREHDYINRPQLTLTGTAYMSQGNHDIRVEYVEFGDQATAELTWDRVLRDDRNGGQAVAPATTLGPWTGAYYANTNLRDSPSFVREDAAIDFDWGTDSPSDGWHKDSFSVRWTNDMRFSAGRYRFTLVVDDGAKLYVDDKLVINSWKDGTVRTVTGDMTLLDGDVPVVVEYREGRGGARVHFSWVLVYPLGNSTTTPSNEAANPTPVLAEGTLNTKTAVRQTFSADAPPIRYFEAGTVMKLAGQRSADSEWVRVVTPNNIWGWISAESLDTDYPIDALDVWRTDW